jgi:hypothetical protein
MRVQPAPRDPRHRDQGIHTDPGGQIMVNYFYKWTPLVIVGTVAILSLPWLGLIALIVVPLVALAALAALAREIVTVPLALSRTISRRWHSHSGAGARTAAVPSAGHAPKRVARDL